ncbi:MAG: hypothetical protein ABUS57_15200 [Pseudomonadota bacterium]
MTRGLWSRATLTFGVLTLLIVFAFSLLPAVRAAHFAQGDFTSALGAFQRASTQADLDAVFGKPADPAILAAMTAGNTLDLYGFIPAYTLFLACGIVMLAPNFLGIQTALPLLALASAADVVETWSQLAITTDYAHADAHLPIAVWCWLKFLGLGIVAVTIAVLAFQRKRYILTALNALPFPAALAAINGLVPSQIMSLAFTGAWVSLLLAAALDALRKDQTAPA